MAPGTPLNTPPSTPPRNPSRNPSLLNAPRKGARSSPLLFNGSNYGESNTLAERMGSTPTGEPVVLLPPTSPTRGGLKKKRTTTKKRTTSKKRTSRK